MVIFPEGSTTNDTLILVENQTMFNIVNKLQDRIKYMIIHHVNSPQYHIHTEWGRMKSIG